MRDDGWNNACLEHTATLVAGSYHAHVRSRRRFSQPGGGFSAAV